MKMAMEGKRTGRPSVAFSTITNSLRGVKVAKFARVVGKIEECFQTYARSDGLEVLSFQQIRDWYNTNTTTNGITSARLINLLRKRPQFVWQHGTSCGVK